MAAGIELFLEAGPDVGVTRVKLAAAAQRAGYTTGAVYKCWARQEDFHRDLARAALAWRDRSSVADLVHAIRHAVDAGAPEREVLRLGSQLSADLYASNAMRFYTFFALRAAAVHDSDLLAASDARVEEGLAAHVELYEALLTMWRRRLRPPMTIHHIARLIAALDEGLAIQDAGRCRLPRIHRPNLGEGVGTEWTLLGLGLEALLYTFTEPIPEGDDDGVGLAPGWPEPRAAESA
ncbi:MAG: hypothetical protein ACK5OX_01870 [Desertimonas sp.]